MKNCVKCGKAKEPTRAKSQKCRACDASSREGTPVRKVTLSLPVDVWDRLDIEATATGKRIGGYLQDLIIKRDTKRNK